MSVGSDMFSRHTVEGDKFTQHGTEVVYHPDDPTLFAFPDALDDSICGYVLAIVFAAIAFFLFRSLRKSKATTVDLGKVYTQTVRRPHRP